MLYWSNLVSEDDWTLAFCVFKNLDCLSIKSQKPKLGKYPAILTYRVNNPHLLSKRIGLSSRSNTLGLVVLFSKCLRSGWEVYFGYDFLGKISYICNIFGPKLNGGAMLTFPLRYSLHDFLLKSLLYITLT